MTIFTSNTVDSFQNLYYNYYHSWYNKRSYIKLIKHVNMVTPYNDLSISNWKKFNIDIEKGNLCFIFNFKAFCDNNLYNYTKLT